MSSSASAIFGVKMGGISGVREATSSSYRSRRVGASPGEVRFGDGIEQGTGTGLMIECSSRPQKKATAHHRKTRPKKTQPWDRNRGPAVYPPLPALPPEWSFLTQNQDQEAAASSSSPPPPASSD